MGNWEEDLRSIAGQYVDGEKGARKRREAWDSLATRIILPTLEAAAETLRKAGLLHAYAKRRAFGTLESVQLETGQSMTEVILDESLHADRLVVEVSASLGYSLGVDGRVHRWQREHRLSGFTREARPMVTLESYTDHASLTVDVVKGHVLTFLRDALDGSYRHPDSSTRRIGFF